MRRTTPRSSISSAPRSGLAAFAALLQLQCGGQSTGDDSLGGGGALGSGSSGGADGGAHAAGGASASGGRTGGGGSSVGGAPIQSGGAAAEAGGSAGAPGDMADLGSLGTGELFTCGPEDAFYLYAATDQYCTFLAVFPEDTAPLGCIGTATGNGYCISYGEFSDAPEFCGSDVAVLPSLLVSLRDATGQISVQGATISLQVELVWSHPSSLPDGESVGPAEVELLGHRGNCPSRG